MKLTAAQARNLRQRMAAEHHATRVYRLDAANQRRHVDGAARQVEAARILLDDPTLLEQLTERQIMIVTLRVTYPQATLRELATRARCTKDTVSGHLRRALAHVPAAAS